MTADEFQDWREYDMLEPLHGTDLTLARMSMMMAAFMGQKDVNFEDFYIHKVPPEPETPKSKEEAGKELNNALQGLFTSG